MAAKGRRARGKEGINEEQRCRVAVCEGVIEKERVRARARKGLDRREWCKETSQALIGNLVDCQLQTNRKSGVRVRERERDSPIQAVGKAKARNEPARISEFLDNAIRRVPAFWPSLHPND